MANVRYSKGGTDATLGTKTIDENGIYNASDDSLDGYSQVTVDVPEPEGSISLTYDTNGTYSEVIKDYAYADVTVNVPVPEVHTQSKTVTATTSQQTVTPNPGFVLDQVVVNPQQHTETYTPSSNIAANDMGPVNNYRYVNTSGMILPTGTKEVSYDTNGTYTESVTTYDNIEIDIDVPVSGTLGTKNIITNGTYTALDDNLDGYSEVTVNVPQNATLGIKSITANGNYTAITDGYDGYSRVDVNVSGATLQANKTVTATTSQQIVQPDQGYDGLEQVTVNPQEHTATYTPAEDTAANDMGINNNYRYVDTSGMVTPTSITPSNANPVPLTSGVAVEPTANGYAIGGYDNITPPSTPQAIYWGDMLRMLGNGFVIDNYYPVTPSDSTPPQLSQGYVYVPTANGYLYETQQSGGNISAGTVTTSTSATTKVVCGFKPKYICVVIFHSSSVFHTLMYDEDYSSSTQLVGSTSTSSISYAVPTSTNNRLASIDNDGFTLNKYGSTFVGSGYYFAIG